MQRHFWAVCMGLLALQALIPIGTPVRAEILTDPGIELFRKLWPVFSHPRCANCHGGFLVSGTDLVGHTQPIEEADIDRIVANNPNDLPVTCKECHDKSPAIRQFWRLAPVELAFTPRTMEELCDLQAEDVFLRRANKQMSYMQHLRTDPLIADSFTGLVGGAADMARDRPPSLQTFLRDAQAWVDAGAPCGLHGTITQDEKFESNYQYPYLGGTATVVEDATRTLTFRRSEGKNSATVITSGKSTITLHYPQVSPTGPCTVTIESTTVWSGDNALEDLSLEIDLKPDGSYTITAALKEEMTTSRDSGTLLNDCGISLPPSPQDPDTELTWPPWKITISCPAPRPGSGPADPAVLLEQITCRGGSDAKPRHRSGEMTLKIQGQPNRPDPQIWLNVSPVGISRADDGKPLPVESTTTWLFDFGRR